MLFNTIIYQEELDGFQGSGMIGLSPNDQGSDAQLLTTRLGVDYFSVNLADKRVMFGEKDPIQPPFGVAYHNINKGDNYWMVPLT